MHTAKDCVRRFKQCVAGPLRVHWIHRHGIHQAVKSHAELTAKGALPAGQSTQRHQVIGTDCQSILQVIRAQLPPNVPPPQQRTGLFLIPDDLIGRCAPQIIQTAQDPSRKIPVFVQQLEYVEPDPANPQKPCALAGYGLTAETMGDEAADYLDQVVRDPDQASSLPVKFPQNFEFWINRTVAAQLASGTCRPCRRHAGKAPADSPIAGSGGGLRHVSDSHVNSTHPASHPPHTRNGGGHPGYGRPGPGCSGPSC